MEKKIRYIKERPDWDGFEDNLVSENSDSSLFESIGDFMRAQSDIEDVKNDPGFQKIQYDVKGMISDYNKNKNDNIENRKFIIDSLAGETIENNLKEEVKSIKQEIKDSKLNELTAEWVKEWHKEKQKIGASYQKTQEIKNFINEAINSTDDLPINTTEDTRKRFSIKVFARYASLSAAALIGLFFVIRTLLPATSDPAKLYTSYYKPFEALSSVTRSVKNTETDNFASAVISYKNGDYQTAAAGFENALEKNNSSVSSRFFLGLSQLALKNYGQAINLLSEVSDASGEYSKEAKWYLGLSYLMTANNQKAAENFEILARSEGYYHDRAEKILRHLK